MEENFAQSELGFHAGHIALVGFVAVALVGLTFMKDPQLFQLHSRAAQAQAQSNAPKYYAYVDPPQPAVLGASTVPPGPSIIAADGSIVPLNDPGQVLGVSTEDVNNSVAALKIATVPSTQDSIQKYYAYVVGLEGQFLGNSELESALADDGTGKNDPAKIKTAINQINLLTNKLEHSYVPADALQYHKLKIARYYAARTLLQNYSGLAQNPDLVMKQMGIFLQAQQQEDQEWQSVSAKYHIADYAGT
jgi:hypothetical protein